jgi:hypothetical protein
MGERMGRVEEVMVKREDQLLYPKQKFNMSHDLEPSIFGAVSPKQ